jgi:oligopeptide/dipeptide ABC transporter ATP-binding protein
VARAIALRPKFIVLDEPVSALDVSIQAQILNLLKRFQQELGLTYLFITHDLRVVKHVSTRVAVMYAGRIVEQGSREEIFTRPHHPYTRALLSSIPLPVVGVRRERMILTGEPTDLIDLPHGCKFQARCPFVMPVCLEAEPAFRELSPGHRSKCVLD